MAAVADYGNTLHETGVYGAYNRFFARVTHSGAAVFKLKYRAKITFGADSSEIVKDIDPIDEVGILNVKALIEDFFKYEYNGLTENTSIFSYNTIQIEIGEVSAATAVLPPTFGGYDTDDTFYFYNGYENGALVDNYREPNWYGTEPIKLPKVQKTLYLQSNDVEILSMISYLNFYTAVGATNLDNLVTNYYEADGTLTRTAGIDLTVRPDLSGVGYWGININPFPFFNDEKYAEVYAVYDTGEGTHDTEIITIFEQNCHPKFGRYRLNWANRYGGEEALNFTLSTDQSIRINRGKEILSDGVNYEAADFDLISDINNPNLNEFGVSFESLFKLRSDYLNQEQLTALKEVFTSPAVLMIDDDNVIHPVIVTDTSYQILDVIKGLQKVEINVKLANIKDVQKK